MTTPTAPQVTAALDLDSIEARAAELRTLLTPSHGVNASNICDVLSRQVPLVTAEVRRLRARVTELEAAQSDADRSPSGAYLNALSEQQRQPDVLEELARQQRRADAAEQAVRSLGAILRGTIDNDDVFITGAPLTLAEAALRDPVVRSILNPKPEASSR